MVDYMFPLPEEDWEQRLHCQPEQPPKINPIRTSILIFWNTVTELFCNWGPFHLLHTLSLFWLSPRECRLCLINTPVVLHDSFAFLVDFTFLYEGLSGKEKRQRTQVLEWNVGFHVPVLPLTSYVNSENYLMSLNLSFPICTAGSEEVTTLSASCGYK